MGADGELHNSNTCGHSLLTQCTASLTLELCKSCTDEMSTWHCTQKANSDLESCPLLWSDGVKRSIFEEVIDVIVVNLDVGHKHTVTAVFIHILTFT